MAGGIDDFLRTDEMRWIPPDSPMVVSASRSGVILDEVEPDEVEVENAAAYFEDRMNRAGHLGEVSPIGDRPEVDEAAHDRERDRTQPDTDRSTPEDDRLQPDPGTDRFQPDHTIGAVVAEGAVIAAPGDAIASVVAEEPEAVEALTAGQERSTEAADALADPPSLQTGTETLGDEVIEGTLAVVPQSASGTPVTYLEDDPQDGRRLAPDERRCTEKTRDGRRCRSYSLKGATMCAGHAGLGLVADPHAHAALAHEARRQMKLTRQVVGGGARLGPRAALRLAALTKAQPLAARIMADALDADSGPAGANLALRVLDAVDPLVTVEATTSLDALMNKVRSGGDPTWSELRAVFGQQDPPGIGASPPEADALQAETR